MFSEIAETNEQSYDFLEGQIHIKFPLSFQKVNYVQISFGYLQAYSITYISSHSRIIIAIIDQFTVLHGVFPLP